MGHIQKRSRRYKARVISGVTTLVLLLAVVICLFVVVQSMSKGYVRVGGYSLFRVVTGSMEPTIPVGTVLLAKETPIQNVEADDIVCFRSTNPGSEGMIVTHRVMGVYETPDGVRCLRTKGDDNPSMDITPVTQANLIGLIVRHTGDGNKMAGIINFLTGDFGFMACVVLPVLLVAVWIFRDAAKNLRKEIQSVEAQLDEQEKQNPSAVPSQLTEEEYQQLYERVKNEVRKEMEPHATDMAKDADCMDQDADADESAVEAIDETIAVAPSAEGEDA